MEPASGPPSPAPIFAIATAYQTSAAVKAAVDLDLFTAIGEGKDTAATLAAARGIAERGARILCDYLTCLGFLTKSGARYAPSREAAIFLDRRSPACMASVFDFLMAPGMLDAFLRDPAASVRRGGTIVPDGGNTAVENPLWVTFARAMMPMAAMAGELLAERALKGAKPGLRVLDVAAGHGLYGIAVGKRDAAAKITALDWRNVLEVAIENAAAAGLGKRFHTIPGSAFEAPLGGPYDLVLVTNFLHHFDPPGCTGFLRRVHAALAPGGRAFILEFVPDEGRVTPPLAAMFPFIMLATTPAGDAYTARELEAMCRDAGFARASCEDLPPTEQRIVIAEA